MKFFLGGVPFGCENIGDEAILAGVVTILRRNFKDCSITVSTGEPEKTAALLQVQTVPLYGFKKNYSLSLLEKVIQGHDVFIWSGATGLSDYPAMATQILRIAQQAGLKTIVWGVGMDSTLNPAFFKLSGKKLFLCNLLKRLSFNTINFPQYTEAMLIGRMKRQIAKCLADCNLIICRDPESAAALKTCSPSLPVFVGSDSAIIFNTPNLSHLQQLPQETANALKGPYEKIGLCISAQRQLTHTTELIECLDTLLDKTNRRLFFIPMNPRTDYELMETFRNRMRHKALTFLIKDFIEPEQVIAIVSQCSVVVSSRLHLLILSANVGTPIVGISRGSKIDNFLRQFGLQSAGNVYDCDFTHLQTQIESFLQDPSPFKTQRDSVYQGLYERLAKAESLLVQAITKS